MRVAVESERSHEYDQRRVGDGSSGNRTDEAIKRERPEVKTGVAQISMIETLNYTAKVQSEAAKTSNEQGRGQQQQQQQQQQKAHAEKLKEFKMQDEEWEKRNSKGWE